MKADLVSKESPYEMIGGAEKVRQIVNRFYEIMDSDPNAARIRSMHAADLSPMRERLFEFLSAYLGGPALYFQRRGRNRILAAHLPFAIGEAERDQWLECMRHALDGCEVPNNLRALLNTRFSRMAEALRNR